MGGPALTEEVQKSSETNDLDRNREELYTVNKNLAHRKVEKVYRWFTLMERDANRDSERQPTRDYVDE